MRFFRNVIETGIAFACYFVGYLIFSDSWVSLAMLLCFWVGAFASLVMEN